MYRNTKTIPNNNNNKKKVNGYPPAFMAILTKNPVAKDHGKSFLKN